MHRVALRQPYTTAEALLPAPSPLRMVRGRAAVLLLLALGPGLYSGRAAAHATGLSYLELSVEGATVQVTLDLPALDLAAALGLDADKDGAVSPAEVATHDTDLQAWMAAALTLRADRTDCRPSGGSTQLRDGMLLSLVQRYDCPVSYAELTIRSTIGQTVGSGYSTFVELRRPQQPALRTLLTGSDASYTFTFGNAPPWWQTAREFVALGVDHIFHGYDHILFLLALLMMCETLRSMVGLATAFTVAHTLTLSLAATRTVVLPSRFTESAIAASIAWVAVENWWYAPRPAAGVRPPLAIRLRWLLTFTFGLIHGFVFASALAERGLPPGSVPLALGCFNLGVELGQVTLIALLYPLLRLVRFRPWYRPTGVRVTAVGIFGLAIYWFVERAFLG